MNLAAEIARRTGFGSQAAIADGAAMKTTSGPGLSGYLSYGVGMTGNQIMRDVPTAMLLFYMTNALMIPPAFAGFAILLPKIWVIVADPLVGALSDRTHGRWGPRKPFLFFGSLLSAATFVLLFSTPTPASPLWATVVIGLLYTALATGYSMYSVPYLTMAAEISDKPAERATALSYKQFFCLIGVVAGLALAPWLVSSFGGGRHAYMLMALILGALMLVTTMATAVLAPIHHVARADPNVVRQNLGRQVLGAFSHRPFRIIFTASTLQLLGFGVNQAGGLYFIIYIMQMPMHVLGPAVLCSVLGAALSQPLWVKLSIRLGTVPAYTVASLAAAVSASLVLLVPPGAVAPYLVVGLIGGATSCGFTLLSFASLIEAIALDGPDSARKGLFASIYTATEKAMLAVGGFVVALTLAAAHFVQGAPLADQPPTVRTAILLVYVAVPLSLKLISVLVLSRYGKVSAPAPALPVAEAAE